MVQEGGKLSLERLFYVLTRGGSKALSPIRGESDEEPINVYYLYYRFVVSPILTNSFPSWGSIFMDIVSSIQMVSVVKCTDN